MRVSQPCTITTNDTETIMVEGTQWAEMEHDLSGVEDHGMYAWATLRLTAGDGEVATIDVDADFLEDLARCAEFAAEQLRAVKAEGT